MSQSLVPSGKEEIDIRKEIDDFPGSIFSAKKVRRRIIDKYGLYLDQHQEHSLGRRVGDVLSRMYDEGKLSIYKRSDAHHPIRYKRDKK